MTRSVHPTVRAVWGSLLGVVLAAGAFPAPAEAAAELRPDLVQRTPWNVGARAAGGGFALGFAAAVENRGDGPLLVRGLRATDESEMTADQLVRRADGTRRRVGGVGRIRYTRSVGHDHWHFLRAVRYELRRASDHVLARPDHKTGFCLGDRYDTGRSLPGKPSQPVITTSCRPFESDARSLTMGISVGYGD